MNCVVFGKGTEMTFLREHSLIPAIVAALLCVLASTRASAQGHDLINAAISGDLPRVKALLATGPDVNASDSHGATALIAASGHQEIVRALIEAKADVNAVRDDGATALSLASKYGHQDVAQLLKNAVAAGR